MAERMRREKATDGAPALIIAGNNGERLNPLTTHKASPAVTFGGKYRIIDFTPSICINSHIRGIVVPKNVWSKRNCRIREAMIGKDVRVPAGTIAGYKPEAHGEWYFVSGGGVVVIPKGAAVR